MEPIIIEKITHIDHIKFIAQGFEETINLWEDYDVTDQSINQKVEEISKWIENPDMYVSVALVNKRPVGFNTLYLSKTYNGNAIAKIIILYTDPEYRNKGIAKKLKLEGERWMREHHVTEVYTEIDAKNERMLDITKNTSFELKSYTFVKTFE